MTALFFFFQAEDGIRDKLVTGVQTCALPISTSDYVAGNNQWSRKIIYNSSGLVQDAYDARQINTHFDYDGLNRVYQITYTDGTPAAHYFYESQVPNGAPSYDNGYATGRLTSMTYGARTSTAG